MRSEAIEVGAKIADEDRLRADMYGFLASLLRAEPSDELLAQVAALKGDDSPIGEACATLSKLAGSIDNGIIRNEYVELFIGVGRGEVLPFASYYLTGFLNDRPLANLRG
ncbi:MAG: TorD/DmsD family molecular chaperone, partial [Candidatus Puniceispirillaceae bacterium]